MSDSEEKCVKLQTDGKRRIRNHEAEDSLVLEAVAREGLMKTSGWKRLSGCCGNL
jgi:hypothetical protein